MRLICTAMLLALCACPFAWAADQPMAYVAVGGNTSAVVLDANGAQVANIREWHGVRAIAIDDHRDLLWLVTSNHDLRAYDFSGELKVSVKLPYWIHDGQPVSWRDRDNGWHDSGWFGNNGFGGGWFGGYWRNGCWFGCNDIFLPWLIQQATLAVDKRDGSIWVGVDHALLKYSTAGAFQLALPVRDHSPRKLSFDWAKGLLWVATDDGVTARDATGQVVRTLTLDSARRHYHAHVEAISFDDRLGGVWVALRDKVERFDRNGQLGAAFELRHPDFLAPDGRGNVWVATHRMLARYDTNGTINLQPELPGRHLRVLGLAVNQNDASLWVLTYDSLLRIDVNGAVTTVLGRQPGHGRGWGHWEGWNYFLQRFELIAANGDINAPAATITAPAANSVIDARPTISLHTADVGLGVNPAYTTLMVNGVAAAVTCTGNSNTEQCVPDSVLTGDPITLTLSVGDYAGNRSATVSVTALLDSDGDGHDDKHDTYPNDPTRYRLAAVTGITAALQNDDVRLDWQPEADTANTEGYLVYRNKAGETTETKLTPSPLDAVHYVDANVKNGTGYGYHVVAVDHKDNPGEAGTPTDFFVAWNHTPITGIKAARVNVAGRLVWDEGAGFRYRIYRSEQGGDAAPLAETAAAHYLDPTPLWYKTYAYQVATIADFTNPFTHKAVHVEGPLSAKAALPPLPPLTMTLNGGIPGADGIPELLIRGATVAVSGAYQQAVGPVNIIAAAGGQRVTATASDGTFRLVLPGNAGTIWTITVSEQTVADRGAQTRLRLIKDTDPPTITLDGTIASTTSDETVTLSGAAEDQLTGIASLYAVSERAPDRKFALIQGAHHAFRGDAPLSVGANKLTVFAADGAGNTASASVTVTRRAPLTPHLVISAPANGAIVTQDHVAVSGLVYTGLDASQVRISLNGATQFPASGDSIHGYPFAFSNVRLRPGYNALTVNVQTPVGPASATVAVNYQANPPPPKETPPPDIDLSPTDTTVNGDSSTISGSVGDGVTVTVDGKTVDVGDDGHFQYPVDLSGCVAGTKTVTIVATDTGGRTTTRTVVFTCDRAAPVIVLDTTLQAPPAVNKVFTNPYPLSGTISDANLAGFTVNGQNVSLMPASANGYGFKTNLKLPIDQPRTVLLTAWDVAGNQTNRAIIINETPAATIELVAPQDNAEIAAHDAGAAIDVVARIQGLTADDTVGVAADGGDPQPMSLDGNVATTRLATTLNSGIHKITVAVRNSDGATVASTSANVHLINQDTIALELDRSDPANNASGVEPTVPVTLYFNKPIDPAKLTVTMKETVHGMGYDLSNQKAAGFTQLPSPKLVRLDRDMKAVPGALSLFPGNRFVSFQPSRELAYGAREYITVQYDGKDLGRFTYEVQPLPTIIIGEVTDQLGTPLPGIEVALPELGLETTTDAHGNFGFGSGAELHRAIPAGRYNVVLNPGMKNSRYGTLTFWANVELSRINTLAPTKIPLLNDQTPFVRISSGAAPVILANGDLKLNLSQARLTFPANGRATGNIHVDFLNPSELSVRVAPGVAPQWLYGLQPSGVSVRGGVDVTINMPVLYGSYAYVPADGTLVAMLGFDPGSRTIALIGIGQITGHQVKSLASLPLKTLDYIGYALVDKAAQDLLAQYRDGRITSLAALRSALADAAGQ